MSQESPVVSLGLPVFNGEPFLEQTLTSLLGQTFGDFELVICDNASTDATGDICRRYAARDPRVRYCLNEQNLGAAKNYNRCFELATGRYFKWCAHDDLCAPTHLERCVDVLDRHPEVALAFPRTTIIDERGRPVTAYDDNIDLRGGKASKRMKALLMRGPGEFNAIFGLIRSSILAETPLIGSYTASDENLLAELALRGEVWQVPEPLFFRRDHPRSSVRAHPGLREREQWFDPLWNRSVHMPRWKWLMEYIRSAQRVPLSFSERVRIYGVLARWMYGRKRPMTYELLDAPRDLLRSTILRTTKAIRS